MRLSIGIVGINRRLLALWDQMEQATIWDPLDLRRASSDEVAAWWKAAVTFPEDFSYQATE